MKKGIFLPSLIGLLALSCTVQEIETQTHPYEPAPEDDVFYASLAPESETKVYLDENIKILWNEADQISIFNETTLNKKYEFMGETGDNAGYFKKKSDGEGTESPVDYVCAVYPYKKATTLSESGVLTLTLPEEQTYQDGSFGLEANTMVSTTDGVDNLLRFKNVGGYIVFKFFGQWSDGSTISVSSIKLEGRNGELLSGEATMTPVIDELPDIEMASTAGTSITLNCSKAVKLGKTEGKATLFWMVIPPTVFSNGILITVTDKDGKVFTKETDQVLTVERNKVLRFAPIQVVPADPLDPNKVIYYTTSNKETIAPIDGADFGATIQTNDYVDLKGIMTFDGEVTQIGAHAFEGCETLTGITIPSTVTSIEESAFARCTLLGAPNTPSGSDITEPSKGPNRSGETTLVIPEGVTTIGAHAFEDCTSLTSIIIPEGVTTIGAYAFTNCTSLTSITIPDSVTSIEEGAFAGCTNLLTINLPENVTMGDDVFSGRSGITSVTIPEGTTSIGDYAYAGCENLTEVIIPNSVTSIGKYAFYNCQKLAGITIPDGMTEIAEGTFAACHSFTSIVIPEGVTSIGLSAFECCSQLTDISLPDGLVSIGVSAFADCYKLTTISIPSTVTFLGTYVLQNCTGLVSITLEATEPLECVDIFTFENTNDCPIYVPAESVDAYRESWSQYASRIYAIGPQTGTINGHAYVDLGTGTKWATMNVGAESETEYGNLYAWGKTEPRIYDPNYVYEYSVFVDVATVDWGQTWRYPTAQEWETLTDLNKFTWTWDSTNRGYWVESKIQGYEGNKIFLPAAGSLGEPENPNWDEGKEGDYWAYFNISGPSYNNQFSFWDVSEVIPDDPEDPVYFFALNSVGVNSGTGLSVRPVSN